MELIILDNNGKKKILQGEEDPYAAIIGSVSNTPNNKSNDKKSLGDVTINDVLKGGKVKAPWFTLGVLLSQKSERDRKHKESMKRYRGGK